MRSLLATLMAALTVGHRARAALVAVVVALCSTPAFAGAIDLDLISSGSGTKEQLRLKPAVGSTQTMAMTMAMTVGMDIGGQTSPPQPTPPITVTMQAKVEDVAANGDISYEFSIVDASVGGSAALPAEMLAGMRAEMKKMVGMKGHAVITHQGITKEGSFEVPPGADPAMKKTYADMEKSMKQMGAPLPTQPVGIGATWKVTQAVKDQGMSLTNITTYELVERAGTVAKMKVVLKQMADPQALTPEGMPPGTTARLVSLDSNGTGTTSIDLAKILPGDANMAMNMNTKMAWAMGGQSMDVAMKLDMTMTMKSN
jgi:hypothetical protein